jgi:hypothetical protein
MENLLELRLSSLGRLLADYQVARFWKLQEGWLRTPCDFYGFTAAGRAILIEAKMVNRPRLPTYNSPGLSGTQWAALREAARANCIALICWCRHESVATIDCEMAMELCSDSKSIPWHSIPDKFIHSLNDHMTLLEPYLRVEAPVSHDGL